MSKNNLIFEPLKEDYKQFFNHSSALAEFIKIMLKKDLSEETKLEYKYLLDTIEKQAIEYDKKFGITR